MKVNIINKTPNKIKNKILDTAKYILKNKKNKTINIKITNEKNIKILNKKYRGKNKTTDVLTFKNENIKIHNDIGTIILCPEIMKKTQKKNHWQKTLIHSILHILNYNHIKNKDFIIMSKIEKKIGMSGIEPPTITTSK
ncbi:rRNA maturation RNase YbeY [Candidatus Azoamicus ciliaticola]|uniref:Endoribonuclease YbeY n=1 Tax=Candidatus Azoamicus ciliaticola TaxID=2652803 RepID=A0A6J5JVR6_9GAMM|nr:Endoribonuclease YbeY [Candidatus Azoamicus ciliaticola]